MTEMQYELIKARAFLKSRGLSLRYQIALRKTKQLGEHFVLIEKGGQHSRTVDRAYKAEDILRHFSGSNRSTKESLARITRR